MTHLIYEPSGMDKSPYPHESFAAKAVSDYLDTDVFFIKRSNTTKSPDLLIGNVIWEIKSPIGNGKRTMQNNLRIADNQSPNIIINLVRCKMPQAKALSRIKYELGKANKIKRLLVVLKNGKVITLK